MVLMRVYLKKLLILGVHGIGINILELDVILKVFNTHINSPKNFSRNGSGLKNMLPNQKS
jgi:hypothetical protein